MKGPDAIEIPAARQDARRDAADRHDRGRLATVGLLLGLAAALAAAAGLWASEGATVFVQNAFAALAACL